MVMLKFILNDKKLTPIEFSSYLGSAIKKMNEDYIVIHYKIVKKDKKDVVGAYIRYKNKGKKENE